MTPGVYKDISIQKYHSGPELGSSMLRDFAKTPSHMKYGSTNVTDAMMLGSYTDALLTEPEKVEGSFIVLEAGRTRTPTLKAQAIIEKKDLITYSMHLNAIGMAESVKKSKTLSRLLKNAQTQESFFWKHPKFGFMCKCRPDFRTPGDIYDLKTTGDASEDAFSQTMASMRYHWQGGWYTEGVSEVLGIVRPRFHFIVVESTHPHDIGLYSMPSELIYLAQEEIKIQCQRYAECLEIDNWPGYPDKFKTISLPTWYYRKAGI